MEGYYGLAMRMINGVPLKSRCSALVVLVKCITDLNTHTGGITCENIPKLLVGTTQCYG